MYGKTFVISLSSRVKTICSLKTVILLMLSLVFSIIFSFKANADEVKVFTVADLHTCVVSAGNVCVLQGNNYNLGGVSLTITAPVTIRASGALATITGGNPIIDIQADRVVLDKISVGNGAGAGIRIFGGVNDVTIQDSQITSNGTGIQIGGPGDVSDLLFLDLDLRNNNGPGLQFINTGSIDRMVINRCVVESNGPPGNLVFANGGGVRNLTIQRSNFNYASGMPAAHGISFANGGGVREIEISANQAEGNSGAGIYFNNTGPVDHITISNNQGITANSSSNIWFDSSVGGISDLVIDSNKLDVSINGSGIDFKNRGIIEDLTVSYNSAGRNNLDGIYISNSGPVAGAVFKQNSITNNHRNGLWVDHTPPNDFRVEGVNFSGNIISQNDNNGARLETGWSSVFEFESARDRFSKNRDSGLQILTDRGDIDTVQFDQVTFDENQNGSGALLQTNNASILNVDVKHTTFIHNGLFGLMIRAGGSHLIDAVSSKGSTYQFNGTRSAVGGGSGFYIEGDGIYGILSENDLASNNNDHGIQVRSSSVISSVNIVDGNFNENDLNNDAVGDGINIDARNDLGGIDIQDCTAHDNNNGFNIGSAGGQISQEVTVKGSEADNNREAGLALISGGDLKTVTVSENTFTQNGIGVYLEVDEVGTEIVISANEVTGDGGTGTGMILDAGGAGIYKNSVRLAETGIRVKRSDGNTINYNDIIQNTSYGVDASSLGPGEEIDATYNWWGEPSGPKHSSNPGGQGDRVTDKVVYKPFLTEPTAPRAKGSYFEIAEFGVPGSASVGASVIISYVITNTGPEEGVRTVTLTIEKGGNIVQEVSEDKTVNPLATLSVDFDYTFSESGTYTVSLSTEDESTSATIQIGAVAVEWPPVWAESGLQPSPVTSDTATLHIEGAFDQVTLMIFDLSGAKVLEKAYTTNDEEVDLAELDNGVFLYVLVAKKDANTAKSEVKKLLVQK